MVFTVSVTALAQDTLKQERLFDKFYNKPKPSSLFRAILNKFSLGVSTGYGQAFYSYEFSDIALLQKQNSTLYAFSSDTNVDDDEIKTAYLNWFNTALITNNVPIDRESNDFLISSDTAKIGYKANARSIPLTFTLHYSFDRYRMGIGISLDFHKINTFHPISFSDNLSSFIEPVNRATFKKYFLILGGRVHRYYHYLFTVDTQFGILKLGKNFDGSIVKEGIYFNLGTSIEREFSEYFTAFIRPSFEINNFVTNLSEELSVFHKQSVFFVNIGVLLKLPKLPRCRVKACHTQVNHTHGGDRNWRSRMHPFYKKQNPGYGENYSKRFK